MYLGGFPLDLHGPIEHTTLRNSRSTLTFGCTMGAADPRVACHANEHRLNALNVVLMCWSVVLAQCGRLYRRPHVVSSWGFKSLSAGISRDGKALGDLYIPRESTFVRSER